MRLASEGVRQMLFSTALSAGGVLVSFCLLPPAGRWTATVLITLIWGWSIAFFRDPRRVAAFAPGVLCAPADGTVRDISALEAYEPIDGPAIRIGIFLSLFNVHINRSPCSGTVRGVAYRKGKFAAAMKPRASRVNESNTLVIDPVHPLPGPVVTRQIAGVAARRIVCHAAADADLSIGERFGLIKYGSRTELIVPVVDGTEVLVRVGDKVRAGLTPIIRQPVRPVDRPDENGDGTALAAGGHGRRVRCGD